MDGSTRWFGTEGRALLILLEGGRIKRKVFQDCGMDYRAAMTALRKLRENGLADFEELGNFKDTQVWFLTERGKVAARKLAELVEFIEGGKK